MNPVKSPAWRVFLFVFAAGLAWTLATGQIWEDYLITYRASKNLAEGKGLTFTEGERVHSFTSPLGVLLPAAGYVLTGRTSDAGALWIFRLMSFAAFGGAAVLLWRTLRGLSRSPAPAALIVVLLATDSKSLCFSANGMETGFMLLFLSWAVWAICIRPARLRLHLGLAFGGLMWTRPDGCIYIGALATGLMLFAPPDGGFIASRRHWLRTLAGAAAICTVVYLPWFIWAWAYYGTPVPHTITAKGLFNEISVSRLVKSPWLFARMLVDGKTTLAHAFLPYYGGIPSWLPWAPDFCLVAGFAPLLLLVVPRIRWEARLAAFCYAVGQIYLTVIVGFPVPWYIPQITLFGFAAVTLAFGQLLDLAEAWRRQGRLAILARWLPRTASGLAAILILGATALTASMARQAWVEMKLIEGEVRGAIGVWLRSQAKSVHESVFLEPLGFIGFYSGLKMLDYPGLASPEVVSARRRATSHSYPFCWSELIVSLRPDWLVLRPFELAELSKHDSLVIPSLYDHVRTFDATPQIRAMPLIPLPGFLDYNRVFEIYRLKNPARTRYRGYVPQNVPVRVEDFVGKESPMPIEPAGASIKAHAPSRIVLRVPAGAALFQGGLGIYEGAYAQPRPAATDGADFRIERVAPDGSRATLLQRRLDPSAEPGDRGLQEFDLDLPAGPSGTLELTVGPGPANSNGYDWSYWFDLHFGLPPDGIR